MKASEIREKTQQELIKEEKELKAELFKLRFQHATNQLENPMKLKDVKKSIARVKTGGGRAIRTRSSSPN